MIATGPAGESTIATEAFPKFRRRPENNLPDAITGYFLSVGGISAGPNLRQSWRWEA